MASASPLQETANAELEDLAREQEAMVLEEDGELKLRGHDGDDRTLPSDLYEKLADISDPYDSSKEFIGYVDPVVGIVLVDASTLEDVSDDLVSPDSLDHQESPRNEREKSAAAQLYVAPSSSQISQEDQVSKTESEDGKSAKSETPTVQQWGKRKTMHQLAYEKKNNGKPLPEDDTRPLSGFGFKKGLLIFSSTTFNAFQDGYHTEERGMGDLERDRLQILLNTLNENEKKSKVCVVL